MYPPGIAIAVVTMVLNIVIGISLSKPSLTASLYFLPLPFIAMVCGFLASGSRDLLVILAEALYILAITMMYSRFELLMSLLSLYVLGAVVNLLKRKISPSFRLWAPANYYLAVLSLGFSLVGAGIIGLTGIPLETPASVAIKRGISTEVLASAFVVYVAQAYISSLIPDINLVILALSSLLSPYTLPLLATLPTLSLSSIMLRAYSRDRRLRLGKVIEVIRGAKAGKLTISFEKGVNRNIVIVGATGTGKSTLAKHLVSQIRILGVPVVIFDVHGEYCRECGDCECIDASELSVDIFRTYEEDPKARAEFVVDAISEIYSLGNLQRIALSKALSQVYGVFPGGIGFDYLLEYLWRASYGEIDLGVPQSVVRSLIPYLEKLKNTFRADGKRIAECIDTVTVVDYSRLSSGVSTIVAEIVTDELYHTFKSSGGELVLVVDEVHRFLKKGRALSRLFREGRKYGISSILITQDVGSIPRELLLNTAVLVSFSLPEISVARYVARVVSPDDQTLYEKILGKLTSLPQFYALVSIPGVGSYIIEIQRRHSTYGRKNGIFQLRQ